MERISIQHKTDISLKITIGAIKDKTSKIQLTFLIFGGIGLTIGIWRLLQTESSFAFFFMIIWNIVWLFILARLWKSIKWRRFGKEILEINGENVTIIITSPFTKVEYFFRLNEVRISKHECYDYKKIGVYQIDPGFLKIEDLSKFKIIRFGKYIRNEEFIQIINALNDYSTTIKLPNDSTSEQQITIAPEFISKKKYKKLWGKFYLFCLIPCFAYGYNEFKKSSNRYLLLQEQGIVTSVHTEFKSHWDYNYCHYYFIAENGKKYEHVEKCPDPSYYNNFKIIYNPADPNTFMEYRNFQNYTIAGTFMLDMAFLPFFVNLILSGWLLALFLGIKWLVLQWKEKQKNTPHNIV